jgi:uncharacterized protein YqjF (DUF2071 family)
VTWLQHWTDVLFLHFQVSEQQLRRFVPADIAIDTHRGSAWLSYVFFRLKLRPAPLPMVPGFSSLLELNVRTYVRYRDRPGIYFLRMYADNRLAIWASRLLTPLRYEAAAMAAEQSGDGSRSVTCRPRNDRGSVRLEFCVARSVAACVSADTLDGWLLERYRAFVHSRDRTILTATVDHAPWQVNAVELLRYEDDLAEAMGIPLGGAPVVVNYSAGVAARFNAFAPAGAEPCRDEQTWPGLSKPVTT